MSYGVPEVRTENANVVTTAIASSDYRLRGYLVGDSKARGEGLKIITNVAIRPVRAIASDPDAAETAIVDNIGKTAKSLSVYRLREVDLPAQSIVDGELGSETIGVLTVKEPSLLALSGTIGTRQVGIVNISGKRGHVS